MHRRYTRMPSVSSFFSSAAWTNLQGIPGFWNNTRSSSNNSGNVSISRRRSLNEQIQEASFVASYYNCTVHAVDYAIDDIISSGDTSNSVANEFFVSNIFYTYK